MNARLILFVVCSMAAGCAELQNAPPARAGIDWTEVPERTDADKADRVRLQDGEVQVYTFGVWRA